eukprot:TRINITY_DN40241_c0_g1_i1.p1 TRINITY_DN40241_c0_g1~~TRINITY_DN40241_c0_g1_i1.p1  ORF type:complete len:1039 (-),score=195.51 TRINITY_DN40241_c0_g1_i1:111-3227(-)
MIGVIFNEVLTILAAASTELILFTIAFSLQFFLFGGKGNVSSKWRRQSKAVKKLSEDEADNSPFEKSPKKRLTFAFEGGDHRAVLRHWRDLKNARTDATADELAKVIESMQRLKKESQAILSEVSESLLKNSLANDIGYMNYVLESLGRSLDTDLADGLVELFPSLSIKADAKTYELLVQMNFATRSFDKVSKLHSRMRVKEIRPTTLTQLAFLKSALQNNEVDKAMRSIKEMPTESIPSHVAAQFVDLVCREKMLVSILPDLEANQLPLSVDTLNSILLECGRVQDEELASRVLALASRQDVDKNGRTYSLLIRAAGDNVVRIMDLLNEMSSGKVAASVDVQVASAVLAVCGSTGDLSLAEKLRSLLTPENPGQVPVASALVRFYAENGHGQQACRVYEQILRVRGDGTQCRTQLDARTQRVLLAACRTCDRSDISDELLEADSGRQVNLLKSCHQSKDFEGALATFSSLPRDKLPAAAWNIAVSSCVELNNMTRAQEIVDEMISHGIVDVTSFNVLVKANLKTESFEVISGILEQMQKCGCTPNSITFNEICACLAQCGRAVQRHQVWQLLNSLTAIGAKPTKASCALLIKSLKSTSGNTEVNRVMKLLDLLGETMDEGLLSCTVEACIRLEKKKLLAEKLELLNGQNPIKIGGAHTVGSIIKGYSFLRDLDGCWRIWKDMCNQHITPTSITIGCMVEAISSNGDVDQAHSLIRDLLQRRETKAQVNSIIYGSVLKGYSRSGRMNEAWNTFEEMKVNNIELSLMTFNAMMDACARNNQMEYVAALMNQMKALGLKPNLITNSTMIKGYCANGDMHSAFAILKDLRRGPYKPDEVVYNTIIEGCLQAKLVNEGERVIMDMQAEGISPSCYALTILVKLLGQSHRVDRALEMVEDAVARSRTKLNIHVHSALVQACINARDYSKAAQLYWKALGDRGAVDGKTCRELIRGLVSAGKAELAAELFQNMVGVGDARKGCSAPNMLLDDSLIAEVINSLRRKGSSSATASKVLHKLQGLKPQLNLDSSANNQALKSKVLYQ